MIIPYLNDTPADDYTPAEEFKNGEDGVFYDASDISRLFQVSTPATAAAENQPVGYMTDKSGNGHHAYITGTGTNRPTLKKNGDFWCVEWDGVNDLLRGLPALPTGSTWILALRVLSFTSSDFILGRASTGLTISQTSGTASLPTVTCLAGGAQPGQFPNFGLNHDDVLVIENNGASSRTAQGRDIMAPYNIGTASDTEGVLGARNLTPTQFGHFQLYGLFAIDRIMPRSRYEKVINFFRARMPATDGLREFVPFGNSITNNVNSTGANGWTWLLGTSLGNGWRVIPNGISSQKSDNIAARIAPGICKITFPSNQIPASGAATVVVSFPTPRGSPGAVLDGPLAQVSASGFGARARRVAWVTALDGSRVYGEFSVGLSGVYSFTRFDSGDPVPVDPAGAPLQIDLVDQVKSDSVVTIWAYRNNLEEARVQDDLDAAYAEASLYSDNVFLINSWNARNEPSGSAAHTARVAMDAWLLANYPDNHFNMLAWLQDTAVGGPFDILAYTPTAQDLTDIANDVPPDSWMDDFVHPGDVSSSLGNGQSAIRHGYLKLLTDKGIIP